MARLMPGALSLRYAHEHAAAPALGAGHGAAARMRNRDVCPRELPLARVATHLRRDLAELADARRAERMPLGEQPAARVDRRATVDRPAPVFELAEVRSALGEPQALDAHPLRDREAIVHFGEVDVVGADAGLVVRGSCGS